MNGGPPNGVQQPAGNLSNGRFAVNSLPATLSQLSHASSHGQSGLTNKGGLGASLVYGNSGPQIANSFGNLLGGGNIGGSFSSNGGLTMTGLASRLSLTGSLRNQSYGVGPQTQEFSIQTEDFPALQRLKGGDTEYRQDLHRDEQLRENTVSMMQSQHLSMARSAGFGLGGSYSSHHQQQQQHAPSISGGGVSFLPPNSQDFLNLHGSDLLPSSNANYRSQFRSSGTPTMELRPVNSSNTTPSMGSYDQLIQQYQQLQLQSQFRLRQMSTVGPYRDQNQKSTNAQAVADRFGLLGLLSVLRVSNPDLTSLALGIDLTTLGLNLNSSEDLHKKFASPWSDEPANGEPEFRVPECYHAKQSPALKQGQFSKFQLETLFYIFYSMPKEEAQLYAANELNNRGWLYHRELWLWLIRVANMEPLVKTNSYERGSYVCFDPNTWKTIRKDNFVLQYEMVEKRPMIPED